MDTKFGKAYVGNHGYYVVTSAAEGNHNKLLHRLIFEDFYGKIPDGCHIHHKDGVKTNNCIMNLQIMTESQHHKLHGGEYEYTIEDRKKMSDFKLGKPNSTNSTGYYRVYKEKGKQYAQGFTYKDELQYYKSKSASLEEELLSLRKRLERYEPQYSDEFLETVANINKISVEELKEIISISRRTNFPI